MKTRRSFLKSAFAAAAAFVHPALYATSGSSLKFPNKYVVTLQAVGGWDVTYFCDPKENQPGSDVITNWSKVGDIQFAGNLRFAPVSKNKEFFERHYDKTLVINGVDSQTNAHSIGETISWSGRTAAGYPSLTALYSAAYAPSLPMSYLAFGGFNKAQGLLRPTIVSPWNTSELRELFRPNTGYNRSLIDPEIWSLIRGMSADDMRVSLESESLIAGNRKARSAYLESIENDERLSEFAATIPTREQFDQLGDNRLIHQANFALLAFKAGVSVAADLQAGGFDSHSDNDMKQLEGLAQITDALDYLWDFAEELGIDDQLVVVVGSDFSRTPFYNSGDGKDHWPIGSYMVMEKNAPFGNKVLGETDEEQNAYAINPRTLESTSFSGVKLVPGHVHKALRRYLGLESAEITAAFPLVNIESIDFFG